jgi:ribonuclease G
MIYRELMRNSRDVFGQRVAIRANPQVAEYLHREENDLVTNLERLLGKQIVIYPEPQFHLEQFDIFETLDA